MVLSLALVPTKTFVPRVVSSVCLSVNVTAESVLIPLQLGSVVLSTPSAWVLWAFALVHHREGNGLCSWGKMGRRRNLTVSEQSGNDSE